ncbi:MAG TPA: helix-turn-helix domain-containing protein [Pyrinomonadaceae bacterium]
MSAKLRPSLINLIRQQYVLPGDLGGLIRFFLRQSLAATKSRRATVCLPGWELSDDGPEGPHAVVGVDESGEVVSEEPVADCSLCATFDAASAEDALIMSGPAAEGSRADSDPPRGSRLLIRMRYQRRGVGVLALFADGPHGYSPSEVEVARQIAGELVHHLKRFEFDRLARLKMGRDLPLVGVSEAMRAVDSFIEKASPVNLLALITGELGCAKRNIAYAVHLAGGRRDGPLVMVNCATMDPLTSPDELTRLYESAHHGTIIFRYLDDLPAQLRNAFLGLLGSGTGPLTFDADRANRPDVRIISTSNKDVQELDKEGRFYQSLLRELNFVHIRVAPLRERKEDIEHLAQYFLREYGPGQTRAISDSVISLFREYDWPYNDSELRQMIVRLAVMAEGDEITTRDVNAFASHLSQAKGLKGMAAGDARTLTLLAEDGPTARPEGQPDARVVQLAGRLSRGEHDQLQHFHSGLRKALEYLAANFQRKISLDELARHACLSPSHLSYLFKKSLGVNFKMLLTIIRIERAKQLLLEQPYLRVTEISAEVGYEELSHFERTFKRFVYCSPREFRQRF